MIAKTVQEAVTSLSQIPGLDWRVVVVKDSSTRRALRDLYLLTWYEYLAPRTVGLTPWAPITDREAEARAIESADDMRGGGGFPENLDEVPVLLVVFWCVSPRAGARR